MTRARTPCSVLFYLIVAGCSQTPSFEQFEGVTMGTYYKISARCPAMSGDSIRAGVADELIKVNKQMSTYDDSSELTRFNQSAELIWLDVSRELLTVVEAAQQISLVSGGAFDITVGPLVNLWGFGSAGAVAAAPSAEAVQAARARVGYQYLQSRSSAPALRKSRDLFVDLSAIAKGHGVDRVAQVLDRADCRDYLVDIGGEVRSRGLSPRQTSWRVGIEVPDPQLVGSVQRVVNLPAVSVATSGDYRNYLDYDGERFSHSIDPRTGYPVQHLLASVSVVHESAMWADGWATALNVLGPEAGLDLAVAENLAAYFLIRRADGFEERYTPAMQNYLEAP